MGATMEMEYLQSGFIARTLSFHLAAKSDDEGLYRMTKDARLWQNPEGAKASDKWIKSEWLVEVEKITVHQDRLIIAEIKKSAFHVAGWIKLVSTEGRCAL